MLSDYDFVLCCRCLYIFVVDDFVFQMDVLEDVQVVEL